MEEVALEHCQNKIPNRPHIPIRFIGVVPRDSKYAKPGFTWIPNCVNEKYINNLFSTEIDGVLCQAWSIVEPEEVDCI